MENPEKWQSQTQVAAILIPRTHTRGYDFLSTLEYAHLSVMFDAVPCHAVPQTTNTCEFGLPRRAVC